MRLPHPELHRTDRIGWLRAAVLGANDGIVSTASLVVGVAAANTASNEILVAGVAGLVAGAMSMAAGEYVSVSSQADTEKADIVRERAELASSPVQEHAELTAIYEKRGLDPLLASQVADQLMKHDALGAHSRDELGISDTLSARPVQAAFASAATFAIGAAMPLLTALTNTATCTDPSGCRDFYCVSCTARWLRRLCRRSTLDQGSRACHVLGCIGDGNHCCGRGYFRGSSVDLQLL